jgi:hypothetical protein
MQSAAPLGRALPAPPVADTALAEVASDDDASCAALHPTPRAPAVVEQLARRVVTGTMLAKYWAIAAAFSVALWMIGTAIALVLASFMPTWGNTPILALGFAGLSGGLVVGHVIIRRRRREARWLAREGQLVTGVATHSRSRDTLGGELGALLAGPLGERHYCISLSIGFLNHEVWVALSSSPSEGTEYRLLVQPGARHALVFDSVGCGHVGHLVRR